MFADILRFKFNRKKEMLQEDIVLPRATERPFLSALHAKNETRNPEQTFLAINLANQQKTKKVYFSSEVRKQSKLLTVPLKPLRCCLRSDTLVSCHVWRFFKDLYLNFRVIWSVNQIVLKMVSSLILLRSLRVCILKQSFFSISVSSGFRNIYLAANDQPLHTSISKNNC